jgi:hypothetical protein
MTITPERLAVLGEVNAAKLGEILNQLYESNVPDYILLGALGFTNIAEGKWKSILKCVPFHDLIQNTEQELFFKLNKARGVGGLTANTIRNERQFFLDDMMYIYGMPNVVWTKDVADIKLGKSIRFTGVRDSHLMRKLMSEGHDVSDGSVTKNTDILIIPFEGYESSKVKKALEYNAKQPHQIRILTLDEFRLNMSTYLMC